MSPNNDRFRVLRRLPEIKFEEELRGYSKSQVDRVLETLAPLADEVDELLTRLSQAETRAASAEARLVQQTDSPSAIAVAGDALDSPEPVVVEAAQAPAISEPPPDFDETLRKTLLLAQTTADETVRNANVEAERKLAEAGEEAEALRSDARQETDDILAENKRTRTALYDEVATERVRLLEDAQTEARTRLVSLEQELASAHGAERDRLLAEIDDLQNTRDQLRTDVELLEGHLAHRRGQLREALSEMTEALDSPEKLRGATGPTLTDPEAVDSASFRAVALPEESVSALSEDLDDGADSPGVDALAADAEAPDKSDEDDPASEPDSAGSDSDEAVEVAGDDASVEAVSDDSTDAGSDDEPDDDGPAGAADAPPAANDADIATAFVEGDSADDSDLASAHAESSLDGPEGEWVDEQLGFAGLANDNPSDEDSISETPTASSDGTPSADEPAVAPAEPLPRRTSSGRAELRGQQASSAGSAEASEGWLSDSDGSEVTWDESTPTGEHPGISTSEIPAVPSPPADVAMATDGEIPEQPAPPPSQRPAEIAADRQRPAWAEAGQPGDDNLQPASGGSSDPFLDELRRVTDEEVDEDDALGRFLNDDEGTASRGGWFGRRK